MTQPDESRISLSNVLWKQRMLARIVVAEDDARLRDLVIERLLDDGHEVYGASSAQELLHLLAKAGSTVLPVDGADLILVGQQLPGMSGLEIVRRLRAARCRIPFLLITALPTSDLTREAARLRVPVLVKPFSLSDLSNLALTLMLTDPSHRDDDRFLAAP